jgi:hypothetical protein
MLPSLESLEIEQCDKELKIVTAIEVLEHIDLD